MESEDSWFRLKFVPFLRKWYLIDMSLGSIDVLAIAMAFQISYLLHHLHSGGFFFNEVKLLYLFLGIMPLWLFVLYLIKLSEIPRTKRYSVLFVEYFQSSLAIAIVLVILYFVFKMTWISRLFLVGITVLGFLFLFIVRIIEYKVFKSFRAKGYNYVNVVLVADESSIPFIENLILNKEWGYHIKAILTGSSFCEGEI